MRKIISILALFTITLLSACSAAPKNEVTPPFFTITDPDGGTTAYLLGTMHIGLPNTVYPDEVYAFLDDCGSLAVEIDLFAMESDQKRLSEATALLKCQNETARDFMGSAYNEIKDFFKEKQLYMAAYDKFIPAMWSSQLSNKLSADCGYESRYGTDRALLTYAKKNDFEITELETVEEQYGINAAEPRELQTYLLLQSVQTDYEAQKQSLRDLYSFWSKGDCNALKAMLAEDAVPDELSDEYAEYYDAMYTERQRKMAEYIDTSLQNGEKVFVAVGAMHCAAEPSILDFLAEKGYTITDVYSGINIRSPEAA